jgi:hypothetical protein
MTQRQVFASQVLLKPGAVYKHWMLHRFSAE